MASNFFGQIFRITTFGESHGPSIGVVIDGCPAGLKINSDEIHQEMERRKPGGLYTSPRKEEDRIEIISGIYQNQTTGAPITLLIPNQNYDSKPYHSIEKILRPSHANGTYLMKYGIMDERGGGRASARETAARVAAGSIAKILLKEFDIQINSFLAQMGNLKIEPLSTFPEKRSDPKDLFCPDPNTSHAMKQMIEELIEEGDSIGGIVETWAHLPASLGEPIYQKMEANLAYGMLSIPASKGFEIGSGFQAAQMRGSENNDRFIKKEEDRLRTSSNHAGGTLGGISTGMPLHFRVAFKPTSSIKKKQQTIDWEGNPQEIFIEKSAKHDPCVAIRAVPVVEAMTALVLADLCLMNQTAQLSKKFINHLNHKNLCP